MALTYGSYLQVEQLLSLQKPASDKPEHDEMLFIIIHQAYELWFKEVLHEIDHLTDFMFAGESKKIPHTMKRIRTIFKVLVQQTDILKTMTPVEFLSFRNKLQTASGFQSAQFRELEFALGYKRKKILEIFNTSPSEHERLLHRIARPSVWDGFLTLLHTAGYPVPTECLDKISDEPTTPSQETQQILREIYNSDPELSYICEGLLDIDEVIQEWRYQHVKTVERILGDNKPGTGGSSGAEYLRGTLFKPFFPDLWAIRSDIAG